MYTPDVENVVAAFLLASQLGAALLATALYRALLNAWPRQHTLSHPSDNGPQQQQHQQIKLTEHF